MKKWLFVIGYIVVISIALLYREPLLVWLRGGEPSQIPLMIALVTFIGLFPVVPFTLIAGIMGSKYGPLTGGLINLAGSLLASVLMFLAVRLFFFRQGRAYLSRFAQLASITQQFEKNAFLAILFARLIPIVPSPLLNVYAAISKVTMSTFVLASGLGKVPLMLVLAFVGNRLLANWRDTALAAAIYLIFIAVTYLGYRWWKKAGTKTARS
ncbi:TVP38/TMEM64 family protein [Brevibacillus fulvus]|uniref:TVP38/TMEM64 family membrane protein n=1 Tax=Brevibacillus fulvus TaxID=1125967 RepID=A0A939BSR7_9BACL|nr:VTT domain-containing protein [Brevibacillus fulvus]MBM7588784.1 putative membrane protein YdjX (TVP38/TMEM64 family) [Brevibacillus fulvus]